MYEKGDIKQHVTGRNTIVLHVRLCWIDLCISVRVHFWLLELRIGSLWSYLFVVVVVVVLGKIQQSILANVSKKGIYWENMDVYIEENSKNKKQTGGLSSGMDRNQGISKDQEEE